MKIMYPQFNHSIELKDGKINSIVIENGPLLYDFIKDLKLQMEGHDGDTILSQEMKPLSISKNMDLITDVICLEIESRSLMNKIITRLEQVANNEDHLEDTNKLLSSLFNYVNNLMLEVDCDLECDEVTSVQLLKAIHVHISDEYNCLTEKLLARMQVMREILGERLFVILNLREYISEEEMELFAETILLHDYKVLFIDSIDSRRITDENRLIIDKELCEI